MPYITLMQSPSYHQITFEEIISGAVDIPTMIAPNESNTRTFFAPHVNKKFLEKFDFVSMLSSLEKFCDRHAELYEKERKSLYDRFYLPKKSGGLREINAPQPELMNALRELKTIFETKFFALYHTSAFAYVPHRCTIDAVRRHQKKKAIGF